MFSGQFILGGFSGLAGPEQNARPSLDYVRAGDVIRIQLYLDAGFSTPNIAGLRNAIAGNTHLRLVNLDSSQLATVLGGYTGALIVEVQALNDFSKVDDVVTYMAGIAQGAGLSVLISETRGGFVSQVEQTAGTVPSNIPAPGATGASGAGGTGEAISNFFSNLTQSPTTLALILGAAVVLVIAAKK